MIDEKTRDLLQLYIDGRLGEKEIGQAKQVISADAEAKTYYKGLIAARKKVKKLEHKAAFKQFAERWPKRVRTEHEKQLQRRRLIRVASSVAAVTLVAFVGVSMLRAGVNQMDSAEAYVVAEESNEMMLEEDAQIAAKGETTADEIMMESAPEPAAAEEDVSAGSGEAMEEQTADTEAADREAEEEAPAFEVPEGAILITNDEGNSNDFFEALLALTEGQIEQPERFETTVSLLMTEENFDTIITFLSEKNIPTEELEIGSTLMITFSE
ncbi:MAG: hypothetical protein AB1Z19_02255 [Eubacteriales bacterium]